jgi:hypothetical protein
MSIEADQYRFGMVAEAGWWNRVKLPPTRPFSSAQLAPRYEVPTPIIGRPPKVFLKPIVSSEYVLGSRTSAEFQTIFNAYSDAYAIDMEGYGFLLCANRTRTPAIVVRGLSDAIEPKRPGDDERWQPIAARHAAAYAFEVVARLRTQHLESLTTSL